MIFNKTLELNLLKYSTSQFIWPFKIKYSEKARVSIFENRNIFETRKVHKDN